MNIEISLCQNPNFCNTHMVPTTAMIKEVAYVEFHQSRKSSTQTIASTCPNMRIEVSRSNIVFHHLITVHWCISLIDARSSTDNENGNQGIGVQKITSVNKCVEVEHLKGSIDQGTLMYSQNYRWRRWWEILPLIAASQKELKITLDSYPRINDLKSMGWNPLEGGH